MDMGQPTHSNPAIFILFALGFLTKAIAQDAFDPLDTSETSVTNSQQKKSWTRYIPRSFGSSTSFGNLTQEGGAPFIVSEVPT